MGTWNSGTDFQAIDVGLFPCASRITTQDGRELGADETCIWDREEMQSYLGDSLFLHVFHNQITLNPNGYQGGEVFSKQEVLTTLFSTSQEAVWNEAFISKDELTDEVDILQLGQ